MRFLEKGGTIALLFGAQSWPKTTLNGGVQFANSFRGIKDYVVSYDGLGIARENVLDMFDSDLSAGDQLAEISRFLRSKKASTSHGTRPVSDLFIYYVGHGSFIENTNDFFILVRQSDPNFDTECIVARSLARRIRFEAPFLRQFIVLDCCFSGAAHRVWQGTNVAEVAVRNAAIELPDCGAVFLCSSAENLTSMAPSEASYTMFTGALLQSLRVGTRSVAGDLTAHNVRDLTWQTMQRQYGAKAIRPVVHGLDHGQGDLTDKPAFPNPAYRPAGPGSHQAPNSDSFAESGSSASTKESSEADSNPAPKRPGQPGDNTGEPQNADVVKGSSSTLRAPGIGIKSKLRPKVLGLVGENTRWRAKTYDSPDLELLDWSLIFGSDTGCAIITKEGRNVNNCQHSLSITHDGGDSWHSFRIDLAQPKLICFGSQSACCVSGVRGFVAFSKNAGQSWSSRKLPIDYELNDVMMIDEDRAIVIGGYKITYPLRKLLASPNFDVIYTGFIIYTGDAGATWELVWSDTNATLERLSFFGEYGLAVGRPVGHGDYQILLETRDGGRSWEEKRITLPDRTFLIGGLSVVQPRAAWITTFDGMYRTNDGGESWEKILKGRCGAVSFWNPMSGAVICDDGECIWVTGDAGKTWEKLFLDKRFFTARMLRFKKVAMLSPKSFWVSLSCDNGRSSHLIKFEDR